MGNQQSTANEGCIEKPLECYQAMNERLVTQVREILHNRDYHDAQVVLEGQDRQPVIFGVNATVLALRSEYFKDKFFPTMEGNPQPPSAPRTVKLGSFMDPETFQSIMSYIHCEMGSMRMTSLSQAWRVRQASTLLQMPDLSDCCDEYIAKHLNKSFAIKIFRQARLFRAEAILEKARQILWKEFKFVLRSCPEIRTLSVDGLIDLIKLLEKKDPDLVLAGVLNWGEGRPSFGEEFSSQLFPHLMWHRMSRKTLSRVAELKILRPDLEHLAMKALISKTKIDLSLADWIECNVSLVLGCRHGSEACDCRSQGIQQMILQSTDSIESMTKKATGLKEATLYPDGFSRLMKKSAQTLRAFEVPPERIQVEILNDEGEDDGVSMEAVSDAKAIIFDIGTAVYIVLKFPPVRPIPGNREVTLSVGFERSLIRDFQERKLNRAKSVQKFENHKNVTDETLSVSFWETTINQTMVANENTTNGELKENVFVFSKIN